MTKNVKKEVAAIKENSQLMTGNEVSAYFICFIFFACSSVIAVILA